MLNTSISLAFHWTVCHRSFLSHTWICHYRIIFCYMSHNLDNHPLHSWTVEMFSDLLPLSAGLLLIPLLGNISYSSGLWQNGYQVPIQLPRHDHCFSVSFMNLIISSWHQAVCPVTHDFVHRDEGYCFRKHQGGEGHDWLLCPVPSSLLNSCSSPAVPWQQDWPSSI